MNIRHGNSITHVGHKQVWQKRNRNKAKGNAYKKKKVFVGKIKPGYKVQVITVKKTEQKQVCQEVTAKWGKIEQFSV